MTPHLEEELSAYLDEALSPAERAGVDAHLAACGSCRARLDELRAVARLIGTLPERAPRRSLIPRRSLPSWLVPARWASSLAAAAFTVAFAVSLVRLPAQTFTGAAAPAPLAATSAPSAAPAPAFAFQPRAAASPADKAATEGQPATPAPRGETAAGAPRPNEAAPGVSHWAWLGAAAAFALVALVLHLVIRRLRAVT